VENIINISGKVKYSITLDPSVWIFDDRKIDLNTYFDFAQDDDKDELTEYKKAISKQWDREIIEGAKVPVTHKPVHKYEKEKMLTGTFGMSLKPFLTNAEPDEHAKSLIIVSRNQEVEVPLEEAYQLILGFSIDGKPLKDDGPVHVYFADGSNKETPIKNVIGLRIT
jgi:hypothetical protein